MHTGSSCFSYPADVPPGTGTRDAAQSAQSGWLSCFSYGACGHRDPQRRPVRRAQLLQLSG